MAVTCGLGLIVCVSQTFLETHILQATPYGDSYMNLRGQEIERRGDEFITSLGFRARGTSLHCNLFMVSTCLGLPSLSCSSRALQLFLGINRSSVGGGPRGPF